MAHKTPKINLFEFIFSVERGNQGVNTDLNEWKNESYRMSH